MILVDELLHSSSRAQLPVSDRVQLSSSSSTQPPETSHIAQLESCQSPEMPLLVSGPITVEPTPIDSGTLDDLLTMFSGKLKPKEVIAVYHLCENSFDLALECLLQGPTFDSLLKVHQKQFEEKPPCKLYADSDSLWEDGVAFYKNPSLKIDRPLRVVLERSPAIDTGGVRRQFFSDVFQQFAENKLIRLFEGPPSFLRPAYSAEARSSGLFRVLGIMIAHSIAQDEVGFPFFSPLCYWYIADGEEKALTFVSLADVGADVAQLITQVGIF